MAYVKIRPRRSTAAEWEYDNPILAEGEMGVEVPVTGVGTGFVKIKFGDGVTPWKDLPYGLIGGASGGGDIEAINTRVDAINTWLDNIRPQLILIGDISDEDAAKIDAAKEAAANATGSEADIVEAKITAIETELNVIQGLLLLVDNG